MAHERIESTAQVDKTENNQSEPTPVAVIGIQVLSSTLSPPDALPNLYLDLIAHSGYRRPPPTHQ
jgi:hypothetical protein